METMMVRRWGLGVGLAFLLVGCGSPDFDAWKADQLSRFSGKASDRAVSLYRKALLNTSGKTTDQDKIRMKLSGLYVDRGAYEDAALLLKGSSGLESGKLLAKVLYKSGDITGALEVFGRYPQEKDPDFLFDHARVLEKSNLFDQALKIYALLSEDPDFGRKAQERIREISLQGGLESFAGVGQEVRGIIESSPGEKEHPEASALYLFSEENFTLTDDDRLILDFHYVIKILNDRGKDSFGEVSLSYDSTYEKIELEYARTIKPDGSVVTVGDKNIRDVSVYLNFPMYSNARVRIISMPEISPGCSIEYKGRLVRNRLPNQKDFDTVYWLQSDEPILLQRSRIDIPANRQLRHKIINGEYNIFGIDMEPKVVQAAGRKIYSIQIKDVPQIIPEPGMASLSRVDPYILFSTFENWEDIFEWWQELYADKISSDQAIEEKVKELIAGKKTVLEKAKAIYHFCAEEIRYVAVEYGSAGYEPHQAREIFRNKYGDCKDQAILLISMLKVCGIEAYPVLISTYDSFDVQEDVPSLLFNHAIAALKIDGELIFMDPTGATVGFGDLPGADQGRLVLVFYPDRYELVQTPIFQAAHNKLLTRMKIRILPDESLQAQREVFAGGVYEQSQRYWLKFTMPALIEEGLKQKVRTFADNAQLKSYQIENVDDLNQPVVLRYDFTAPRFFIRAGVQRIMNQLGGIDTTSVVKESRRYPIELGVLDMRQERIEVEFPSTLLVQYLPQDVEMDTKWFSFSSRYELGRGNSLVWNFSSQTKERLILPGDYAEYKKTIEAMASIVNEHVVFTEKKKRR